MGPDVPARYSRERRIATPFPPPWRSSNRSPRVLIAERYERRSVGIISNLVFSQGERIFANPMTTAAAIDRVVHHSVILGFDVTRFRTNAAQQRGEAEAVNRQNWLTPNL